MCTPLKIALLERTEDKDDDDNITKLLETWKSPQRRKDLEREPDIFITNLQSTANTLLCIWGKSAAMEL